MSSWIKKVEAGDFEGTVLQASRQGPVLVDFWAPWCQPCLILGPVLERVVESYKGRVLLAKLNTDENPDISARYGIQGIPAVKGFLNGEVRAEFVGVIPESRIREFIDGLIPSEADKRVEEARSLERADAERALTLYEKVLGDEPGHPGALTGKIRVFLNLDRLKEARALLDTLPVSAGGLEEASRLRTRLELALVRKEGPPLKELLFRVDHEPENLDAKWSLAERYSAEAQYPEALDLYLEIMKKDRGYREDGARKAVLKLFEMIGPRSPLADEVRKKMSKILF
ncbi:MAG TPA: tetratricopeptide repeat protein [Nitrospiria bacterium]